MDAETRKAERQKRYAARTIVNGKFFAAERIRHGTADGYLEHGCRCDPCGKRGVQMAEVARKAGG